MSSQALDCTRAILTRRLMVWSSGDGVEHRIELAGAVERVEIVAAADMLAVDPHLRHGVLAAALLRHLLALGGVVGPVALGIALEIGRASCRARVCPSVSIPVVAVSFKKKKN